jgi:hypothetical protein
MIRSISISIVKFATNYMPVHKRKPVRLNLLTILLSIYQTILAEFESYRQEATTKAQVTGETMSIEWYLNEITGAGGGITIESMGATGVSAGIKNIEPTIYITAGLNASEPNSFALISLKNEASHFGTKKFVVYVPISYMGYYEQIIKAVNSYRAVGKTFKIIEY